MSETKRQDATPQLTLLSIQRSISLRIIEDVEPYIATMKKQDPETLAPLPTYQLGEVQDDSIGITHDAVFGVITDDGPNYRNAS